MTAREDLADTIAEPEDGTRLVRVETDGTQWVIWRNDNGPNRDSDYPDERWYEYDSPGPFGWREIVKYARALYPVADEPLTPEHDMPCGGAQ